MNRAVTGSTVLPDPLEPDVWVDVRFEELRSSLFGLRGDVGQELSILELARVRDSSVTIENTGFFATVEPDGWLLKVLVPSSERIVSAVMED